MSSSENEFPTILVCVTSNHTRFYAEWGNFCLREYLNNKWMFNVNTENWKICKLCLPWCWPGECCSRCSRCCPSPSPRGCTRPWRPAAPSAACTAASSPLNPGWRWTPSWKCKTIKSLQDHSCKIQGTSSALAWFHVALIRIIVRFSRYREELKPGEWSSKLNFVILRKI